MDGEKRWPVVGAVAKVIEATFSVGEETAGGSAHAVTIGPFDDAWCGGEGGEADGVVLGTGPETENDEIGFLGLPPEWIADVLLINPENRRDGRFRISDFGMWPCYVPHLRDYAWLLPRLIKFVRYCGGSTRFGRRMHDKVGIVAEFTEGFCQKAEVAVPEKLVGADGEVGVEKDFQAVFLSENFILKSAIGQSHSKARKSCKEEIRD